jgi:hypothetical protein
MLVILLAQRVQYIQNRLWAALLPQTVYVISDILGPTESHATFATRVITETTRDYALRVIEGNIKPQLEMALARAVHREPIIQKVHLRFARPVQQVHIRQYKV